jgi:hypothetical protein
MKAGDTGDEGRRQKDEGRRMKDAACDELSRVGRRMNDE